MNFDASIIVPTFNRADLLPKALQSLICQSIPPDRFEIIVVDNGSTDGTRAVVDQCIRSNTKHQIRYIYDPEPGLLTGRHRGAQEARSSILCFVDDDIEAEPDWLQEVLRTFEDPTIHLVGGKCLPIYDVPPPAWEKSLWQEFGDARMCHYYSLIDQGNGQKDCDPNLIWGLFFCIRRETLYMAGGFHPDVMPRHLMRYLGDGETGLTMKIAALGLRSVYQPRAVLYHHVTKERLTVEYLERRAFYQGCCDSYTMIRKNGRFVDSVPNLHDVNASRTTLFGRVRGAIRNPARALAALNGRFTRRPRKAHEPEWPAIQLVIKRAYAEGFNFHQSEAKKDPELVQWFLKSNYFDYRLPGFDDQCSSQS